MLMHHRNPTSTANVYNACHPFSTRAHTGSVLEHTYIGVHNGVIHNPYLLKGDHAKRGITYVSKQPGTAEKFNDSEALIYELALYIEGKKKDMEAAGAMAWILMELDENDKPLKLHFGRNTNPLKIHRKKNKFLTLSSEGPGVNIEANTHYVYDYAANTYTKEPMTMESWKSNPYRPPASTTPSTVPVATTTPGGGTQKSSTDAKMVVLNRDLPNPSTFNRQLANRRYTNGYYDDKGIWHGNMASPAVPDTAYQSPLRQNERDDYAAVIPADNIEAYVDEAMEQADYDKDDTLEILKAIRGKHRVILVEARRKMLEDGAVSLTQEIFDKYEIAVGNAEMDLYMAESAFMLAAALDSDYYIGKYMEAEEKKTAGRS